MLQPVPGNISVKPRIVYYPRKEENEKYPQAEPRQAGQKKEPRIASHQLSHAANIACFQLSLYRESASYDSAQPPLPCLAEN
jgi:hypothetical protein